MKKTHPCTVLFPTDFSETSRAALSYTEGLTRHLTGQLYLLHVNDGEVVPQAVRDAAFEHLKSNMADPSIVKECITRTGKPAEVIAAVSIEKWADFIVMGVHGTDEKSEAHTYRIAYDVIRSVRCPVFTLFVQPQESMVRSEPRVTALVDSTAPMSKTA